MRALQKQDDKKDLQRFTISSLSVQNHHSHDNNQIKEWKDQQVKTPIQEAETQGLNWKIKNEKTIPWVSKEGLWKDPRSKESIWS